VIHFIFSLLIPYFNIIKSLKKGYGWNPAFLKKNNVFLRKDSELSKSL